MPKTSRAVTVPLKAAPAVAVPGRLTTKLLAAAALTETVPEVPVIEDTVVSVAVTVCDPAIFKVKLNVPVPATSVEFAGRTA